MFMITILTISTALLGVLIVTYAHLPFWLQRLLMVVPPWMQAATLHFAYAGWIGGVIGHLVGALISAPWFLIVLFWLRPRIQREISAARRANPRVRFSRRRNMHTAEIVAKS